MGWKTQWKSVSLSRHHPSILQVHLWGGALLSHCGPEFLTCDAPYLTSSPAHHLRALAQSTMWTKKQKDWAKTLNPKPRILHTSYNILDWLSDVFVMNEFLWYSTPTYLVQRVEFLCSPMCYPKEGTLGQMGLFLQYLLNQAKAIGKLCDVTASDGNVSSVQFTSLL